MSYREKFNAEDWQTLKNSFTWVFKAIAGIDGKVDKKEKQALGIIVDNANNFESELGIELLNDIKATGEDPTELTDSNAKTPKEGLTEVGAILDRMLDNETAVDFKKLIIAVGAYIGDASGKWFDYKFSDDEEAQLNAVGRWLGTSTEAMLSTTIITRILAKVKE